jgi:hypothetical protein
MILFACRKRGGYTVRRMRQNGNHIDERELLKRIAAETARMATPGSFYGRVLAEKGTRDQVEDYFVQRFPLSDLYNRAVTGAEYPQLHQEAIKSLSTLVEGRIKQLPGHNRRLAFPISAKLVDTFMHQLMKYEQFRYLYRALFLPLDRRVLTSISKRSIDGIKIPDELSDLGKRYRNDAYSIPKNYYNRIQEGLLTLLPHFEQLEARIELNCVLWT